MAHTPTETAESLTQFDIECARFLGHEIHPVHFSQRAHIKCALVESHDYATNLLLLFS